MLTAAIGLLLWAGIVITGISGIASMLECRRWAIRWEIVLKILRLFFLLELFVGRVVFHIGSRRGRRHCRTDGWYSRGSGIVVFQLLAEHSISLEMRDKKRQGII